MSESLTNKVLELVSNLVVHSSIICSCCSMSLSFYLCLHGCRSEASVPEQGGRTATGRGSGYKTGLLSPQGYV